MIQNKELARKMVEKQEYENSVWIKKLFSGFKTEGGQSLKNVKASIGTINKNVIQAET